MKNNLRLLYLYLFSFIGLIIVVIGSIQMVDLALKTFIFKNADRYYIAQSYPVEKGVPTESKEEMERRQDMEIKNQRDRQLVNAISMIVVGLPLYLYHWSIIKKEV